MRTSSALKPLLHRFLGLSFTPRHTACMASLPPSCPPPAEAPPHDEMPANPECLRLHAQRQTDEVGWLTSLQQDVEDQTLRVQLRLAQVRQELSADPAKRALQEQLRVLQWQQRTLNERQPQVAQRLHDAQGRLAAGMREWLESMPEANTLQSHGNH
jgi:hypothetical protein